MKTLLIFLLCLLSVSAFGQSVAIRSSSGQGTNLTLKGSGALKALIVDTNKLVVSTNGNVGIGTNGPAAALHINSGTNTSRIIVEGIPYLTNTLVIGNGGRLLTATNANNPPPIDPLSFESSGEFAGQQNTIIGWESGVRMTTGNGNTVVGYEAGYAVTNGDQLTLVGWQAGRDITSGYHITALGVGAGRACTTNIFNVFVGTDSGLNSTGLNYTLMAGASSTPIGGDRNVYLGYTTGNGATGSLNTVIGAEAATGLNGTRNTIIGQQAASAMLGSDNFIGGYRAAYLATKTTGMVAIGSSVLQVNTNLGAEYSVGIGHNALTTATNSIWDVAIGYQALQAVKTAGADVAVGKGALVSLVSGIDDVAIGRNAFGNATSGNFGVAVGSYAGNGLSTILGTVTIGYQSLFNASGANNTMVGHQTGNTITSGANNTFIGFDADTTLNTGTNMIAVGSGSTVSSNNMTVIGNTATVHGIIHGQIAFPKGINSVTNVGQFNVATNFMVLNTRYTNDATLLGSRRSLLWVNVAVTNTTPVSVFVDQDADGTYEENFNTVYCDSVGLTNIIHLSDTLQPGAFFVITNVGPGTMGVFSSKLTGL